MLSAVDQHPYLLKSLFIDQRLMGVFNNHPVLTVLFQTLFGLVADLHSSSLDHIAQVGFVLEHLRDTLTGPQAGVRAFTSHVPTAVGCWCRNAFFIKSCCNLSAAHAIQCHGEDPSYYRSHFLVDDDFIFLRRVHLVAVHGLSTDELPLPLLISLDGFDLLGNVLSVHIVHDSTEWGNVISCGLHTGVYAVQQGNVAYSLFGKISLHIMTGHDIITTQTG